MSLIRPNKQLWLGLLFAFLSISFVDAKEKSVWIDIRTPSEWSQGHLSQAINIPYDQISTKIFDVVQNKDTIINVYGSNGRRSIIAQRTLESLGFTNVQNLGSYQELKTKED